MGWDVRSGACPTCRGWSCLACVTEADHDVCLVDCPDCDDYRNKPEQPWDDGRYFTDTVEMPLAETPRPVTPLVPVYAVS